MIPYIYFIAVVPSLVDEFAKQFADVEEAEIAREDFESFMDDHPFVDGIVSPANSLGLLTGGYDKALRDYFGVELQQVVRDKILTEWYGEQTVGTSITVDIPGFPGKKLIHTPTMRTPSIIADYQVVYLCMRSTLMAAIKEGVKYLVIPAFGAGTGRVPEEVAVYNMRAAYDQIKEQLENPQKLSFRTVKQIIGS